MKVSALQNKLAPVLPLLCCPLCRTGFTAAEGQLRCQNGHAFDLSARGYVNLAPGHDQKSEKYNAALFDSRSRIFQGGFYIPVAEAIETMIENRWGDAPFAMADIGCGEGYYARALDARFPRAVCLGLDLSRDGVLRAAREPSRVHWLVADLKRLPIADGALDLALDVLTPADYAAFGAALKQAGELIKVIPGDAYLWEIREAVKDSLRRGPYDNKRVIDHLEANADIQERVSVRRTFPLTPSQSTDFLRMTPLTFSVPEEALARVQLDAITIHMEVLRCKVR